MLVRCGDTAQDSRLVEAKHLATFTVRVIDSDHHMVVTLLPGAGKMPTITHWATGLKVVAIDVGEMIEAQGDPHKAGLAAWTRFMRNKQDKLYHVQRAMKSAEVHMNIRNAIPPLCEQPLADEGFISYRCASESVPGAWIMIGALNADDAYAEALRSDYRALRSGLQQWVRRQDGSRYEPC